MNLAELATTKLARTASAGTRQKRTELSMWQRHQARVLPVCTCARRGGRRHVHVNCARHVTCARACHHRRSFPKTTRVRSSRSTMNTGTGACVSGSIVRFPCILCVRTRWEREKEKPRERERERARARVFLSLSTRTLQRSIAVNQDVAAQVVLTHFAPKELVWWCSGTCHL